MSPLQSFCFIYKSVLFQDETGSVADFWTFAKGLKWLNPVLSPFIEGIRKSSHQGESKGQVWVRESLLNHNLTAQLKVLVNNKQHLHSFYFGKK